MKKALFILIAFLSLSTVKAQVLEPVKWTTKTEKISDTEFNLILNGTIDKDWHVYSQFTPDDGPLPLVLTFKDAKAYLQENGLNLGAVLPRSNVRDTANAFVYKQNPERFDEEKKPRYIQSGQIMDVWISVEMPKDSVDNN